LQTLRPEFLEIPARLTAMFPPRPPGFARDRETFGAHTGLVFDPQAAAESWIDTELDLLLNPERLARIVAQNAASASGLALPELFDAIESASERSGNQNGTQKEIGRAVEKQFLHHLLKLALNHDAEPQVTAYVLERIADLETKVKGRAAGDPAEKAHDTYLLTQIDQFRRNPKALELPKFPKIPDGSPIGADY
jgi:hypothetical protein